MRGRWGQGGLLLFGLSLPSSARLSERLLDRLIDLRLIRRGAVIKLRDHREGLGLIAALQRLEVLVTQLVHLCLELEVLQLIDEPVAPVDEGDRLILDTLPLLSGDLPLLYERAEGEVERVQRDEPKEDPKGEREVEARVKSTIQTGSGLMVFADLNTENADTGFISRT